MNYRRAPPFLGDAARAPTRWRQKQPYRARSKHARHPRATPPATRHLFPVQGKRPYVRTCSRLPSTNCGTITSQQLHARGRHLPGKGRQPREPGVRCPPGRSSGALLYSPGQPPNPPPRRLSAAGPPRMYGGLRKKQWRRRPRCEPRWSGARPCDKLTNPPPLAADQTTVVPDAAQVNRDRISADNAGNFPLDTWTRVSIKPGHSAPIRELHSLSEMPRTRRTARQ